VVVMTGKQSSSLIVLLAVSIAVAFSMGYWSGMLSVQKDENEVPENLWLLSNQAIRDDANNQWNISVTLENLGRANSTVVLVLINGKDPNPKIVPPAFGKNVTVFSLPLVIKGVFHYADRPGNGTIIITIKYGTLDFSAGTKLEIRFHTSAGCDYPVSVILP